MSGAALSSFIFLLLCLQESARAKNIQHHQQDPTRYASQGGGTRVERAAMSHLPFNDVAESEEADGSIWYDDSNDGEIVDGCDTEEGLLNNPMCQTDESDGFGDRGDMRGLRQQLRASKRRLRFNKRRLRFNKRRLRFVKKIHPEHSALTPAKVSGGDVYPRESRKPRLRFVKRDLKKVEAQNTHAEESFEDKRDTMKHSRKRRQTDTSINEPLRLLANMLQAELARRRKAALAELRAELLARGKRTSPQPSLRLSDITNGALSKAFSGVLGSLMGPSR